MSWRDDLKEKMKKEIDLKESNSMPQIVNNIKKVFTSIENDFKEISFKGEPIIYSKIDENNKVYLLTLNTLKRPGPKKTIRCKIENQSGSDIIQVSAIMPETEEDIINIAGIYLGKHVPKIVYLENAKKINIFTEEEEFSQTSFDELVQHIFEYEN